MKTLPRTPSPSARAAAVGAVVGLLCGAASARTRPPGAHLDKHRLTSATSAILVAGNGIYTVFVDTTCGLWTAQTGPLHPAGAGLDVLFGGGVPGTTTFTFRSYSTGTDYTNASIGCNWLCSLATPTVSPIQVGAVTTGYVVEWEFSDAGRSTLRLRQEVNVEGPVDGSESIDDTAIRETHTVENPGALSLDYGLRKLWDWQIGPDDGPWLATCDDPAKACDRSLDFFADGSGAGVYPASYAINSDPAAALCPPSFPPLNPAGCGGLPPYLVAGTVAPPSALMPPPDPPEMLQFNDWDQAFPFCWEIPLFDSALCGAIPVPDDTTMIYYYGLTAASANQLAPGSERSYTQYVVAATPAGCPLVVDPCRRSLFPGAPLAPLSPGRARSPRSPQSPQSPCSPASPASPRS